MHPSRLHTRLNSSKGFLHFHIIKSIFILIMLLCLWLLWSGYNEGLLQERIQKALNDGREAVMKLLDTRPYK